MVNGATKLLGVMGNPIAHSLSPAMHNAAFAELDLNFTYVPLLVEPEQIGVAIKGLETLGFKGANVTVPLKQKVIPYLDELSAESAKLGAVNTIIIDEDGHKIGDNTDWRGFVKHLETHKYNVQGKKALILGSGGSARAVIFALNTLGADITLVSRNPEKASSVLDELSSALDGRQIPLIRRSELGDVKQVDLIINTTPVGMAPLPDLSPWPDEIPLPKCELVYDLIYNPRITKLMGAAMGANVKAVNGLGMLLYQAAFSFEMWTGFKAPIMTMMKAAETC